MRPPPAKGFEPSRPPVLMRGLPASGSRGQPKPAAEAWRAALPTGRAAGAGYYEFITASPGALAHAPRPKIHTQPRERRPPSATLTPSMPRGAGGAPEPPARGAGVRAARARRAPHPPSSVQRAPEREALRVAVASAALGGEGCRHRPAGGRRARRRLGPWRRRGGCDPRRRRHAAAPAAAPHRRGREGRRSPTGLHRRPATTSERRGRAPRPPPRARRVSARGPIGRAASSLRLASCARYPAHDHCGGVCVRSAGVAVMLVAEVCLSSVGRWFVVLSPQRTLSSTSSRTCRGIAIAKLLPVPRANSQREGDVDAA